MVLNKIHWTKKDITEFQNYLLSLSRGKEKGEWEKRIVNTTLPCIAVPSKEVGRIVKEISKGNYLEFLDLWIWDNFTNTTIIGGLICKISDFETLKKYLNIYSQKCDNWATCDSLKLKITSKNKSQFFELAKQYISSSLPFVRRIGITTLFKFVDDDKYINEIFSILNTFKEETHYYVNMANAWLIAECFTKQKEKTYEFLKSHSLNKFTINKAISKCRDSFRVAKEDKELLLKFRQ